MKTTVYADLLFLINFSMDFLCFYITAKLLHRKLSLLRAIVSSAFGGLYAIFALLSGFTFTLSIILDIIACVVMCVIVFYGKHKSIGEIILVSAVYFAVSAALGGLMSAIFSLLNRMNLPFLEIEQSGDGISVWAFAVIAVISGLITAIGGKFFKKSAMQKIADVEIEYKGKRITVRAICDSGNLLCEPVSGLPVIVIDAEAIKELLPIKYILAQKIGKLSEFVPDVRDKIFLIPAQTATGGGLLYAFSPDKIRIHPIGKNKSPYEVEALFAPSEIGKTAQGYSALLPVEIMS